MMRYLYNLIQINGVGSRTSSQFIAHLYKPEKPPVKVCVLLFSAEFPTALFFSR